MSDFLGNLIARAAQRAPVLERRQRAIFEPDGPSTEPFARGDERVAPLPEAVTLRPTIDPLAEQPVGPVGTDAGPLSRNPAAGPGDSRTTGGVPPAGDEDDAGSPINAPSRNAASGAIGSTRPPGESAPPFAARDHGAVDVAIAQKADSVVEPPRITLRLAATAMDTRRPAAAGRNAAARDEPPQRVVRAQRSADRSVESPTPAAFRATSRAIAAGGTRTDTSDRPSSAAPGIALAAALARTHRETAQQDSSRAFVRAPSVYVTIGRVEVRAAVSAEPTRHAAKAAAPRLSLDDYLRERSGSTR